ncbi:MAG: FprA family A-type flavoprotein [Bacteroidetes bacterium]|nr:FprA family A-type flavoprotein [Bacteroidota bacterium]
MYKPIHLIGNIYWVGVNDRRIHLFENIWPVEKGVSYNAYIIRDKKTALIDTVEEGKANELLDKAAMILGEKESPDYLVINHLEPDHSGAIRAVVSRYPDIRIVGNKTTFKILNQYYGINDHLIAIENNPVLDLGEYRLTFMLTPMLHWPETMMTYDEKDRILFSGDAFGSFGTLDGGITDEELNMAFYEDEIRRYYSNIVGKYWNPVQRALSSLEGKEIRIIAPTHGPVWRKDVSRIVAMYEKWSRFESDKGVVIVFGSMYGHTEKMADTIARALCEEGIRDIRVYDSSKTHASYILSDIFRYKGVILGSSAYNSVIFPPMEGLLSKILNTGIKNRLLGIFGSATWGGGGVKAIEEFAKKIQWEVIAPSVQAKGSPDFSDLEKCEVIGRSMAMKLCC